MLRKTKHAHVISEVMAMAVTLAVQAAFAFQKYRFNNGLVLGTTLAAVNWYENIIRRKGLLPSRVALDLVATSAAIFTLVMQRAAPVFAR